MTLLTHTFRLSAIAAVVLVGTQSHAVYNLYKKDGLSIDINGQIDVQATKQNTLMQLSKDGLDVITPIKKGFKLDSTDNKTRIGQPGSGISYLDVRGSQILPQDWRATANIGLNYSDENNLYLANSSLSLDKKDIGAISIGRQYLHTNYVNRAGIATPLDTFSSNALRLDYYGLEGLHASAYYSFTGSNDVRQPHNTALLSGMGASASYKLPFAHNQSLRTAIGVTQSTFKPVTDTDVTLEGIKGSQARWRDNSLNKYPEKTQGIAGSLEYQMGSFLVAADLGRKYETMSKSGFTPLKQKTSNYWGGKLAYNINPVFGLTAGYGVIKTKATLKDGATPLSNDIIPTVNSVVGDGAEGGKLYSYVSPSERHLFDQILTKQAYAQADYRIRPNVRLYGRYEKTDTANQLGKSNFSTIKDNTYRAGVVFTF